MTHRIATETRVDFEVALADQVYISDGMIWPATDDDIDLGDATHHFADIHSSGHMCLGNAGSVLSSRVFSAVETVDTDASFYSVLWNTTKTAGASDFNDVMTGFYSRFSMNQAAGEIGWLYGLDIVAALDDGTIGNAISGTASLIGGEIYVDANDGTVTNDIYGLRARIDQEVANTVDDDVFGIWIDVDLDGTVTGTSYMLYLNEGTGIDYGIYQDGSADNYLNGDTGIGETSPGARLHVDQSAAAGAIPVLTLDQADEDYVLAKIIGTAAAASADRTLVADSDFGTPGALVGWIQIEIQDDGNRVTDGDYYVPFYEVPT